MSCHWFDAAKQRDETKYYYKEYAFDSRFGCEYNVYHSSLRHIDLAASLLNWACDKTRRIFRFDRIVPENDSTISVEVLMLCEDAALRKLKCLHNADVTHRQINANHVLIKEGVMEREEGTPVDDFVYLIDFSKACCIRNTWHGKEADTLALRDVFSRKIAERAQKEAQILIGSPANPHIDQTQLAELLLHIDLLKCPELKETVMSMPAREPILIYSISRAFDNFQDEESAYMQVEAYETIIKYLNARGDFDAQLRNASDEQARYLVKMKSNASRWSWRSRERKPFAELVAACAVRFGPTDRMTLKTCFYWGHELFRLGSYEQSKNVLSNVRRQAETLGRDTSGYVLFYSPGPELEEYERASKMPSFGSIYMEGSIKRTWGLKTCLMSFDKDLLDIKAWRSFFG